jgi:putative oxidoreductase
MKEMQTMFRTKFIIKILTGRSDIAINSSILLLRCTVGVILFSLGAGKLLGWFEGFGLAQTIKFYGQAGISVQFAYLSIYTEFIGGLLLTIGLLTRPLLVAVFINMLVATILTWPTGFFVTNGAVLPFTFLICAIVLMIAGPMDYSIDYVLFRKFS